MKIKKVNKIVSVIMLFLILFSVIQPVFAASGSGTWSGGQYASGMKTTDNAGGTTGVLIRRLNNLNTGEKRTSSNLPALHYFNILFNYNKNLLSIFHIMDMTKFHIHKGNFFDMFHHQSQIFPIYLPKFLLCPDNNL